MSTAAASFSTVDVPQIEAHPKNPRHKAAADDELVASVLEHGLVQPLIVAPIGPEGGSASPAGGVHMQRYILIAGHRRLHALKKAKIKVAPCVVRRDLDTEAKQLEAMLLENSSRVDLTPIEEAEGYEQLTLLGYKQGQIAKLTGRSPKTISTRLRLLKLAKSTQAKVHTGQLTIDDAAAFVEFADDPTVTKKLETAAKSGNGLKYEIETQRRIRKNNTETATLEAELTARGVPVLEVPEDKSLRDLNVRNLWNQTEDELASHAGCLAWYAEESAWSGRAIRYCCTDPAKHADEAAALRSEADARREAERDALRASAKEEAARQQLAERLRFDTLLAAADDIKLDQKLAGLLASLLPAVVHDLVCDLFGNGYSDPYRRLCDAPDAEMWGARTWDKDTAGYRALVDHVDDISEYSDKQLLRTLVVVLGLAADQAFCDGERTPGKPYADLLSALGHDFCELDQDLRDALEASAAEEAS